MESKPGTERERESVNAELVGRHGFETSSLSGFDRAGVHPLVLVVTTTPREYIMAAHRLTPLPGGRAPIILTTGGAPGSYILGTMGSAPVVVIKTAMGGGGILGAQSSASAALALWHPKLAVAAGVGYGILPGVQAYSDVMVCTSVIRHDLQKASARGDELRLETIEPGPALLARFRETAKSWKYTYGGRPPPSVVFGDMLSGSIVWDDRQRLSQLIEETRYQSESNTNLIGGEMEGHGLATACSGQSTQWIVVKAICDFGGLDGAKDKSHQDHATSAAMDLLVRALSDRGWIDAIPHPAAVQLSSWNHLSEDFIKSKSHGFVGREWLVRKLDARREEPSSGSAVLLTADPGVGKSSFAAQFVSNPSWNARVAAYHFCRFGNSDTLDPRKFVESVAKQLSVSLPRQGIPFDNPEGLAQVRQMVVNSTELSPASALTSLFRSLPRLAPRRLWMVVDSLDEAMDRYPGHGSETIVHTLRESRGSLPPWLKILATTRKEREILSVLLEGITSTEIAADGPDNRRDVEEYVRGRLAKIRVEGDPDLVSRTIAEKSAGNFYYASSVLSEENVREAGGRLSAGVIRGLPSGLNGLYQLRMEKRFPTERSLREFLPVLQVICAAGSPVPLSILQGLESSGRIGEDLVGDTVDALGSVLHVSDSRVAVYHRSFTDWWVTCGFRAPDAVRPIRLKLERGHGLLSQAGFEWWRRSQRPVWNRSSEVTRAERGSSGEFWASELVIHALKSRSWHDLSELSQDWFWLGFVSVNRAGAGFREQLVSMDNGLGERSHWTVKEMRAGVDLIAVQSREWNQWFPADWNTGGNFHGTMVWKVLTRSSRAVEMLKHWVVHGFDVGYRDSLDRRLLHGVCNGKREQPELLLHVLGLPGVEANYGDKFKKTPLSMACENGFEGLVWILLERGVEVNVENQFKLTPLSIASEGGHEGIAQMLLRAGAKGDGTTPLHFSSRAGDTARVRALLEGGAEVNAVNSFGQSPLGFAAQRGHAGVVRLLLDKGASVNGADKHGWSPLHQAASGRGSGEVVRMLIEGGARVSAGDRDGVTPLHLAASRGFEGAATVLLDKGASLAARSRGFLSGTPLHAACGAGRENMVRLLVGRGAGVNAESEDKETPLHLAARTGSEEMVRFLLDHGADVGIEAKGVLSSGTPLHYAASNGREGVCRLLIEHGADVNAQSTSDLLGGTPLHGAARGGYLEVVRLLVAKGANVNARDMLLMTPLRQANSQTHPEIVSFLESSGATT